MNIDVSSTPYNNFCIGLDLGQSGDYTAMAIIERISKNGQTEPLHLRHLDRYPLGTSYTDIADDMAQLVNDDRLTSVVTGDMLDEWRVPPRLVIDRTGVGRPFGDSLRERGVMFDAVTFTSGDKVTRDGNHFRVPVRDLVYSLVISLQSKQLQAAKGMKFWDTLVTEAMNFRRKVNIETGHDSYHHWREGDHDDLVFAVCLACWGACRGRLAPFYSF